MDGFIEASHLMNQCGVYVLFRDNEMLYIGKSRIVPERILQHRRYGLILFNRVMVQWCAADQLDQIEYLAICKYKPRHNKEHVNDPTPPEDLNLEALGLIPRVIQAPRLLKFKR